MEGAQVELRLPEYDTGLRVELAFSFQTIKTILKRICCA